MKRAYLVRLVTTLIALAVVMVFVSRLFGPTLDADGAVSAYLDAVRHGETPPTCRLPPPALEDFSDVDDYRIVRTSTSSDSDEGTVVFDATRDGRTQTYMALVVRERGTWKWCGTDPSGP